MGACGIHGLLEIELLSPLGIHPVRLLRVFDGLFSLEMPYKQVRRMLFTMHSAHEDFAPVRERLGIEGMGLDYDKIKTGTLSENEEIFLKKYVVPDWDGTATVPHEGPHSILPEQYGNLFIEAEDPQKRDFTIDDLQRKAGLIFARHPFSMLVVDHAGLMAARNRYSSTTEKLNEVIRDLKKLALYFNRGMGMAVVVLFQISREGFRAAEKNGGRYNLTHLSYANECERSADIVTASYVDDELRKMNKVIFQCLKSRDQKPFERIPVRAEFASRRLLTDDTPISEVDAEVQSAKGIEDEDKKAWKKKAKRDEQLPDLDLS